MPRISPFSRNMNSINLKVFPTWFNIKPWEIYRNMKGCILEPNLEGQGGNQECLPFC